MLSLCFNTCLVDSITFSFSLILNFVLDFINKPQTHGFPWPLHPHPIPGLSLFKLLSSTSPSSAIYALTSDSITLSLHLSYSPSLIPYPWSCVWLSQNFPNSQAQPNMSGSRLWMLPSLSHSFVFFPALHPTPESHATLEHSSASITFRLPSFLSDTCSHDPSSVSLLFFL